MGQKQNAVETVVDAREHVGYYGVTMTGKTTLAREHAAILDAAKYSVIVYDPVHTETANGSWPERAEIISNEDDFFERVQELMDDDGDPEHPIFFFVDESPDVFGHANTHAHLIARRIRHNHVYLRFIAQRPNMIHPSTRTMASYVYMLRLARNDAVMICADMGHGSEVANETLDKGDCLLLTSGSAGIEKFNVFDLIGVDPDDTRHHPPHKGK